VRAYFSPRAAELAFGPARPEPEPNPAVRVRTEDGAVLWERGALDGIPAALSCRSRGGDSIEGAALAPHVARVVTHRAAPSKPAGMDHAAPSALVEFMDWMRDP
jgi:hypothetical protein